VVGDDHIHAGLFYLLQGSVEFNETALLAAALPGAVQSGRICLHAYPALSREVPQEQAIGTTKVKYYKVVAAKWAEVLRLEEPTIVHLWTEAFLKIGPPPRTKVMWADVLGLNRHSFDSPGCHLRLSG